MPARHAATSELVGVRNDRSVTATPLIAIHGPTASGKSALAVEVATILAEQGEAPLVVSADAIAVYAELPILSGAPSLAERAGIEHSLIGHRSVREAYGAGEYANEAHTLIDDALRAGRPVIVAGGTGLYLSAAISELALRPNVPPEVRERWQRELERRGSAALHAELARISNRLADGINPNDGRRVTRALELIDVGEDPHAGSAGLWERDDRHPTLLFGIVRDPDELKQRISRRSDAMFDHGLADEVAAAQELGPSGTARAAIGWDEALRGDRDGLKTRTWQYARRQRTWMRKMEGLVALEWVGEDPGPTARRILAGTRDPNRPAARID